MNPSLVARQPTMTSIFQQTQQFMGTGRNRIFTAEDISSLADRWTQKLPLGSSADVIALIPLAMAVAESQEAAGAEKHKLASLILSTYLKCAPNDSRLPDDMLLDICQAVMNSAITLSKLENSPLLQEDPKPAVPWAQDSWTWTAQQAKILRSELPSPLNGQAVVQLTEKAVPLVIHAFGCIQENEQLAASIVAKATKHLVPNFGEIHTTARAILRVLIGYADRSISLQNDKAVFMNSTDDVPSNIISSDEPFPLVVESLDGETLKLWLTQKKAVLIDVRQPEEWTEIIPGAKLIPLADICAQNLPPIEEGQQYVVYCRTGRRSERACEKLLEEDPSLNLFNLVGGIQEYARLGGELGSPIKVDG